MIGIELIKEEDVKKKKKQRHESIDLCLVDNVKKSEMINVDLSLVKQNKDLINNLITKIESDPSSATREEFNYIVSINRQFERTGMISISQKEILDYILKKYEFRYDHNYKINTPDQYFATIRETIKHVFPTEYTDLYPYDDIIEKFEELISKFPSKRIIYERYLYELKAPWLSNRKRLIKIMRKIYKQDLLNNVQHEDYGIKFLLGNGYDRNDIIVTNSSPDIITKSDNQGWEVKFPIKNTLFFTENQLSMDKDTNIIIIINNRFSVRKFKDVISGSEYKCIVTTNVKMIN